MVLFSLMTLNFSQEANTDSDPLFVCQIALKETSAAARKVKTIIGSQANSYVEQVQYLRSPFCSCLGLTFSNNNFQGRIATFKFGGNDNWWRIPYLARSLIVTCGSGISNSYFVTS